MSSFTSITLSRRLLERTVTRGQVRRKGTVSSNLVLSSTKNNVTTITLNDPGRVSESLILN